MSVQQHEDVWGEVYRPPVYITPWYRLVPCLGSARRFFFRPRSQGGNLSTVLEDRPVVLSTRPFRSALRIRMEPVYRVPVVIQHTIGRSSATPVVVKEESCAEMQVPWSTSYQDLYHDLQKRAASMFPGLRPHDTSGSIWVEYWGEKHSIDWRNWTSDTQHMLGIPSARLRFEFHLVDTPELPPIPEVNDFGTAKEVSGDLLLSGINVNGVTESTSDLKLTDDEARSINSQAQVSP